MSSPDFGAALREEQARGADRLLKVRVIWYAALAAILAKFGYGYGKYFPDARVSFHFTAAGLVGAIAVLVAVRVRPSLKPVSGWAILLIDLPTLFLSQWTLIPISATPGLSAAMGMTMFVMLVIVAQISLQQKIVLGTGIVSAILQSMLFVRGNQWWLFPYAMICLGFSAVIAVYLPKRTQMFVREATARMREMEAMNQELRRQIADRAGQLATAISRLSATPRAIEIGAIIEDRYRVLRELGKGGMGSVYEVERLSDQKRLALKVLAGVADREALVRFAREAQIAAQLDHPNVVSVLDVDVSKSGMLFLVMELVAGNSLLAQRAKWGDREWARAILKQIAEALSAMHAQGIVHRDLKPANVLLDGKIVKVADFGIATLRPRDEGDSTITKGMTQTGAFMGTPIYMAPELAKGAREAEAAADVWSFGVLAHELLTGKLPFAEPPIVAKLEGRPVRLSVCEAFAQRCLSEDPRERPTAGELSALI